MSQAGFAELEAVMKRPKFDRFLAFNERKAALDAIRQTIAFSEP